MNLQDYAQFYIGCRCLNTWFPESHEMHDNGWVLNGVSKGINPYELENETHNTHTSSIKLILRRLEDITDDEIKEFIGWNKLNEMYVNVSFERGNFGIIVHYSIDAGDQGVYKQSHNITFHSFSPKEWHYLLSKGFDLFFLIKNGLAIDSKTLK